MSTGYSGLENKGKFMRDKMCMEKILTSLVWTVGLISSPLVGDVEKSGWEVEPLGGIVEPIWDRQPKIKRELSPVRQVFPVEGKGITLVEEGHARALLVIPARANSTERMAAELVQSTVEEGTGVRLLLYRENELHIDGKSVRDPAGIVWQNVLWIGDTEASRVNGITVESLVPDGYRLLSRDHWLFVKGNDRVPGGRGARGTFYAAVELVERFAGVRWLWPGELGTVIPEIATLKIPALNEQNEPALRQRIIRAGGRITDRNQVGLNWLGGGEQVESHYREVMQRRGRWASVQRLGSTLRLGYGHAYGNWYEQYGEQHPEWFALQPSGDRIQTTNRPRLCKSNIEVSRQAAQQVLQAYQKNPGLDTISISPNDGSGWDHWCMCEECRKLDPENGQLSQMLFSRDRKRFYVEYPSLTDRVTTFYNRIAEEVAKENPEIRLGAYAYSSYRKPPLGVVLHPSITIGFVGLGYFDERARRESIGDWDAWSQAATELILRPNLLHGGRALPALYAHRLAEDIRHCYQTGMIAADFDSLMGHWSTQGLNYYILARLLWDPSVDVEALIEDYCHSGFGNVGEIVHAYFRKLEELTLMVALGGESVSDNGEREEDNDFPDTTGQALQDFNNRYFHVMDTEQRSELRQILQQARTLAEHEVIAQRVDFLICGLDYMEHYHALYMEGDRAAKSSMLNWYRTAFRDWPEAINAVYLLWRTGALFRGLE